MTADDMLAHYSRALDEIYRLRTALAYEARVVEVNLQFATLPKTARMQFELQRDRMRRAARGDAEATYATLPEHARQFARVEAGMKETLTRGAWEATP